ncbi:MAG: hypothetical protein IJO11_07820 [Alphaproteobacteria bacterium]|nr:hypothetical protein [Alphaproteobacteria bacterium]
MLKKVKLILKKSFHLRFGYFGKIQQELAQKKEKWMLMEQEMQKVCADFCAAIGGMEIDNVKEIMKQYPNVIHRPAVEDYNPLGKLSGALSCQHYIPEVAEMFICLTQNGMRATQRDVVNLLMQEHNIPLLNYLFIQQPDLLPTNLGVDTNKYVSTAVFGQNQAGLLMLYTLGAILPKNEEEKLSSQIHMHMRISHNYHKSDAFFASQFLRKHEQVNQ